jgi:hypothetical protein
MKVTRIKMTSDYIQIFNKFKSDIEKKKSYMRLQLSFTRTYQTATVMLCYEEKNFSMLSAS